MPRNRRRAEPRWIPARGCYLLQLRLGGQSEERSGDDPEELRRWRDRRYAEVEADEELRRSRARLEAAGWTLPTTTATTSRPMRFADCATRFIAWLPASQASANTVYAYSRSIERALRPILGDLDLSQITPTVVDTLLAGLRDEGRDPRSYRVCLSAICSWAVREGLMTANPCHRPRALYRPARQDRTPRPPPVTLTRDERTSMLDAMPRRTERHLRYRAATMLAGWAGLRFGEVLAAGEDQLRRHATALWVDRQWVYTPGVGWVLTAPKWGSVGLVPLAPVVVEELTAVRDRARRLSLAYWLAQDDGGPQEWGSPDHGWKHALRTAAWRAGIGKTINPQMLRATAFTLWIAAGIPDAIADSWLRHSAAGKVGDPGMSRVGEVHYLGGADLAGLDRGLLD